MTTSKKGITAVPTNIITGFLGAGKTSAILHLLKSKPVNENWTVLVNEFGEIGIDGSLFEGQHKREQGIFIKEVPGGCMCCAAGLPMQVALNQLLTKAKPDRLLIEPTGLGHPEEVLQTLSSDFYKNTLSLQKIIALVDARKLYATEYTEHSTFNQQITIADIIIGNKLDLYKRDEKQKLESYIKQKCSADTQIIFTQNGQIEYTLLVGETSAIANSHHNHHHHHHAADNNSLASELPIPECGYIKAVNKGEGFYSVGWRFSPYKVFERNKLFSFLSGVIAERLKAVFITDKGVLGYNLTSDALSEFSLDDCLESRIEIISAEVQPDWEEMLLNCLISEC